MDVNLNLSIVFGAIGVIGVAWKIGQDLKRDSSLQEVRHAEIMGEIKHINATITKMEHNYQDTGKLVDGLRLDIVDIKRDLKHFHRRINDLEAGKKKRSPREGEEEEENPHTKG